MAAITVSPVTDKAAWEGLIAQHPEANFLQSWLWGELYERLGKPVYRSGFYRGEKLVGAMLSIVEPARRARYLTVPAGPIIDWRDQDVVQVAVAEMRRIGKAEQVAFVRVRPQIIEDEFGDRLFKQLGFRQAQMHLHAELTSQLDITKDEEELRENFRKNTRYELKQAKKQRVRVTATNDPAAIDEFYEVQLATAQRHGFVPFGKTLLQEEFRLFAGDNQALLYSAYTNDDQLIAQALVIFYNQEGAYHYGASTELGRRSPGAYAIQWEAIKEAKRRGLPKYNFWGVVGPEETKHRFYGVSVFKRGFRGEDVQYLHARDLVLSWPKYLVNWSVEFFRKKIRHL